VRRTSVPSSVITSLVVYSQLAPPPLVFATLRCPREVTLLFPPARLIFWDISHPPCRGNPTPVSVHSTPKFVRAAISYNLLSSLFVCCSIFSSPITTCPPIAQSGPKISPLLSQFLKMPAPAFLAPYSLPLFLLFFPWLFFFPFLIHGLFNFPTVVRCLIFFPGSKQQAAASSDFLRFYLCTG